MKDVKAVFRNLEKMLRQSAWFEDGWEIFNRGSYMQLYKSNWYNANQGGVHFETFIEDAQFREKAFPISLHAEEDCPSQQRFIEALIDSERGRIQGWKGYRLVGKGPADPCARRTTGRRKWRQRHGRRGRSGRSGGASARRQRTACQNQEGEDGTHVRR